MSRLNWMGRRSIPEGSWLARMNQRIADNLEASCRQIRGNSVVGGRKRVGHRYAEYRLGQAGIAHKYP